MILRGFVLMMLGGIFCVHARAQVACPWLTEGTAASVLGGPPEVAVKVNAQQEGSCLFSFQNEATRSTLNITVAKHPQNLPELSCPINSPSLKGIGNKAVICHLPSTSRGDKQLVLSQVRDTYFSIVLTSVRKDAGMPAAERQQDAITMIAEQVAGSLF